MLFRITKHMSFICCYLRFEGWKGTDWVSAVLSSGWEIAYLGSGIR